MRRPAVTWRALCLLVAVVAAGCVPPVDTAEFPARAPQPTVAPVPRVEGEPVEGDASTTGAELRRASLERRAREMTVRIRATGCGALGTGSGFAIGDGIIVTNRHVVESATRLSLNTWDGASVEAQLVGLDLTDDLALVQVDRQPASAGALAAADPVSGAAVTVVGYPLGGQQTFTDGEVVDYARLDTTEGPRVLRVAAEIWPGNSGGPVLDDTGRVVGVVFAIERATDFALAVPVSQLRRMLARDSDASVGAGC